MFENNTLVIHHLSHKPVFENNTFTIYENLFAKLYDFLPNSQFPKTNLKFNTLHMDKTRKSVKSRHIINIEVKLLYTLLYLQKK